MLFYSSSYISKKRGSIIIFSANTSTRSVISEQKKIRCVLSILADNLKITESIRFLNNISESSTTNIRMVLILNPADENKAFTRFGVPIKISKPKEIIFLS